MTSPPKLRCVDDDVSLRATTVTRSIGPFNFSFEKNSVLLLVENTADNRLCSSIILQIVKIQHSYTAGYRFVIRSESMGISIEINFIDLVYSYDNFFIRRFHLCRRIIAQ